MNYQFRAITAKDMPESPLIAMQILCNQLLRRWLLWHVLATDKHGEFQLQFRTKTQNMRVEWKKKISTHQWRKAFISMSSQNRKPTMGTRIRGRQSFTERMDVKSRWWGWWRLFLHGVFVLLSSTPRFPKKKIEKYKDRVPLIIFPDLGGLP